jgi:hypothetical protein
MQHELFQYTVVITGHENLGGDKLKTPPSKTGEYAEKGREDLSRIL